MIISRHLWLLRPNARTSWLSLGIFPRLQWKKLSFGGKQLTETAKTKRDPPLSNQREGDERRLADSSEWCHLLLLFFSIFLFFLNYPLSRCLVHPRHFNVSVGEGRPSLIESAVLYLLGPPQPFVCFSPISVVFFLSSSPSPISLFLFHQSHQVFLSTGSSQLTNLYFLVTASWL